MLITALYDARYSKRNKRQIPDFKLGPAENHHRKKIKPATSRMN